jgi:hypothetical protein
MGDWDGALGGDGALDVRGGLLAETLGLAMARKAADVLSRHRDGDPDPDADTARFAAEDAVFTAVLDAANECLGRFDGRPAADRWCDALLQVLRLADAGPPL